MLFAMIGLYVTATYEFVSGEVAAIYFVVVVLVPAIAAVGTWYGQRWALAVTVLFFVSQCVREISPDSLIPAVRPIAVAFPVSDLLGSGIYLVDAFAIVMVLAFSYLLWVAIAQNKPVAPEVCAALKLHPRLTGGSRMAGMGTLVVFLLLMETADHLLAVKY